MSKLWLPGEPLLPVYSIRNWGDQWVRNIPAPFANGGGGQGGGGGGQALAAPTNLAATPASSSQINLTWTDNATADGGYKVEHALSGSGPWTQVGTTAANATSYNDTGLDPSTQYFYRVRAFKGGRNGPFSAVVSGTTAAAGLAITAPTQFWTMDAASGNEIGTVGGITLADNNTVTSAAGKVNTARQFTAANSEYFSAADAAGLQLNTDCTLGLWVYLDSVATSRPFFNKGTGEANSQLEYLFEYSTAVGNFRARIFDSGSTAYTATFSGAISLSTWYCLMVKWDGSKIYFSRNGANWDVGVAAAAYPRTTAGDLRVGARMALSALMDGRIDCLSIWKGTLLTNAELALFYNSGNGTQYNGSAWSL